MNGNVPPDHEFLEVPSREDSTSPVPNGDSHLDSQGSGVGSSGGNNNSLSRITTGKSGRVIEKLMSDVDRLSLPPRDTLVFFFSSTSIPFFVGCEWGF